MTYGPCSTFSEHISELIVLTKFYKEQLQTLFFLATVGSGCCLADEHVFLVLLFWAWLTCLLYRWFGGGELPTFINQA